MAQKRKSGNSGDLFIEGSGQLRLVEKSAKQKAFEKGKVECLGMTFDSEDARRSYFTERLREKLAEAEFRNTDGFPNGSVEDIVALSDPPYFTACPNPFIPLFLEQTIALSRRQGSYFKEPFVADVSEGKNDPIYNLHSYHTKVPHKAIMRYMLHYTEPGTSFLMGSLALA